MSNKGFTLIELVMIIIILGILAAVAVPKYIDLKTDAENAAIKGIYGAIQSTYGISIASVKGSPKAIAINANLSGNPGDLSVNGVTTSVQIRPIAANQSIKNSITGTNREGVFYVNSDANELVTAIGTLVISAAP